MQEEAEDEMIALSAASDTQGAFPITGGLSRALGRPPSAGTRSYGRAFSLHNLLDQVPEEDQAGTTLQPLHTVTQPTPPPPPLERRTSSSSSASPTPTQAPSTPKQQPWDRKQEVIDGVNDLIEELKDIDSAIAAHAPEHIHNNEIILTFGYSRTVAQFMTRAREKCDFQAIVAEGAPTLQGHEMATELAKIGIRTTAIADAAVYAMMSRVNKVVISAHALLADGGVMAPVGTGVVAAAAKRHNVPFVVLVGIYKLSPHFPHEPGVTFNDFKEPSDVLPYDDEAVVTAEMATDDRTSYAQQRPYLQVHNPSYDYIPPGLISLFITDHGHGFMPSYVYRQLSEFYHRQDYEL